MFSAYLHWWDVHPLAVVLIVLGVVVLLLVRARWL